MNIIINIMEEIQKKMYEVKRMCPELDNRIEELQNELKNVELMRLELTARLKQEIFQMEEDLNEEILVQGYTSFINEFGSVKVRKGYIRRSYNSDALDTLCKSSIELMKQLSPFRKESLISPTVTIEISI